MKQLSLLLPLLFTTLVTGCGMLAQPGDPIPSGQQIGEPIENRKIHTLQSVQATPANFFNQTILVTADVAAVCQSKGCWMKIQDGGQSALVRWETGCGGKYAFPKDSAGRRVLIQGSFYAKELDQDSIEHMKAEAGDKDLKLDKKTYEMNASAVVLLDAEK